MERRRAVEYKVESFGCMFSTRRGVQERIEETANRNAAQGWRLHSWEIPGATASFCEMVFYREIEE